MLRAASVHDLKQSGVLPLNAIELLDFVPEILIARVSFFPCLLILLLVSLLLHSLHSFTMESSSLFGMAGSPFISGMPKVLDHFFE